MRRLRKEDAEFRNRLFGSTANWLGNKPIVDKVPVGGINGTGQGMRHEETEERSKLMLDDQ
jgi:hypothetical protein